MDANELERFRALEAKVEALESALQETRETEADPASAAEARPGTPTRRKLLWGAGAAAVGTAGAVLGAPSPASAATPATDVTFTPTGNIAATNVQAALAEVDAEKVPTTGTKTITGVTELEEVRFGSRPWVDITAFDAVPNGNTGAPTNNTTFIQNAINHAQSQGGGTVLIPRGVFGFSGTITVPSGVDLWGCGGHQQGGANTGTMLKALASTARLEFRDVGGVSGNFGVSGEHIAGTDSPTGPSGLVYIKATARQFIALRVSRSTHAGVVLDYACNNSFDECQIMDHLMHGLVLEQDTSANLFTRCDMSNSGGDNIQFRSSNQYPPDHNTFIRCAVERGIQVNGDWTGPNNSQLNIIKGGWHNLFIACGFVTLANQATTSDAVVHLADGITTFQNCDFMSYRPGHSCIKVTRPGALVLQGRNALKADFGVTSNKGAAPHNTDPSISVLGRPEFQTARTGVPIAPWAGTGRPHEMAKFGTNRPLEVTLDPADYLDPADGVRKGSSFGFRVVPSSNSGYFFQVAKDGEIQINDGNGWAPKARWKLLNDTVTPDGLKGWGTPNNVHLDGGWLSIKEIGTTPGIPSNGDRAAIYVRGDKLVVAFKDASGALKYRYMNLAGTDATWTFTPTAPT